LGNSYLGLFGSSIKGKKKKKKDIQQRDEPERREARKVFCMRQNLANKELHQPNGKIDEQSERRTGRRKKKIT